MVFHFVWLHHVVVVRDNSHMSDSSLDYAIELADQVGVNARGAHLVRDRFSEIIEIGGSEKIFWDFLGFFIMLAHLFPNRK